MRGHGRPRAEWERLVGRWHASGLSQQAFARRERIVATTFSWWVCRLRRESPALVPVKLVGAVGEGADLRVELGRGRTIHVPACFDGDALKRLLALLEDGAC